jgi:hypothetical protein
MNAVKIDESGWLQPELMVSEIAVTCDHCYCQTGIYFVIGGKVWCNPCYHLHKEEIVPAAAPLPSPEKWFESFGKIHCRGGARKGAGRKKSPDAKVFKTVGLTSDQWAFVELFMPGRSATDQICELVELMKKYRPSGPGKFR